MADSAFETGSYLIQQFYQLMNEYHRKADPGVPPVLYAGRDEFQEMRGLRENDLMVMYQRDLHGEPEWRFGGVRVVRVLEQNYFNMGPWPKGEKS